MTYNKIYENLLSRSKDRGEPLVGMIAYSLYKKQKTEFFEKLARANTPVTNDKKDVFHASFTESALENLENQARQLILAFANDYLEADIAAREAEIIEHSVSVQVTKLAEEITSAKESLVKKIDERTKFSLACWSNVVSSFLVLMVSAVIAIAWALNSPDFMRKILAVFAPI